MLLIAKMFASLIGFFRVAITPVKITIPPAAMEQDGALVNNGALLASLSNLQVNGAPTFGNFAAAFYTALTANTYNANDMVGGVIVRMIEPGASGNRTDSTDTATNIVNAIPGATPLQSFPFFLANLNSGGTLTLGAGTGVTITGSTAVQANSVRLFMGQITGSTAVALRSCFSFSAAF